MIVDDSRAAHQQNGQQAAGALNCNNAQVRQTISVRFPAIRVTRRQVPTCALQVELLLAAAASLSHVLPIRHQQTRPPSAVVAQVTSVSLVVNVGT